AIAFSIGRQCCAAPAAAGDSQALTACTTAVARALPLVQKAASNYPKNRNCFSCHHQTLPMVAMVAAREGGATVDDKLLHGQAEFTHKWFAAQVKNMKLGRGIGGRAMNVGYGLWALRLADSKADETTEAMITYLVKTQ